MLKQTFIVLVLLFSPALVPLAQADTFTVDSTLDEEDTTTGDGICATASGICTLRAAVQEANYLAGDDDISLPAGTYTLTLIGSEETESATGDLNIKYDNVTITGVSNSTTIIDGNGTDRIFYVHSVSLNLSNVRLTNGNVSGYGGAIYSRNADIELNAVDIIGNFSWGGGGIGASNVDSGDLSVTNSNISQNTATHPDGITSGGGIYYTGAGNVIITDSTISQNIVTATGYSYGGGIDIFEAAEFKISNSTISGNTSTGPHGNGGGVSFASARIISIYSSTITANTDSTSGGGVYFGLPSSITTIKNSIIATNTAPHGADCSGYAAVSNGYNLIGDTYGCTVTATTGDQFGSSSLGTVINPGLDALADNGGDTQTHALQTTSPAKNAADPAGCTDPDGAVLNYDQRGSGYDRVSGSACDIGAYELQVPNLPPIANPGINHTVYTAKTNTGIRYNLVLDGSHSADPEGGILTYSWSVASVPSGSAVTTASIADPTLASTSVILDHAGSYVFRLVVTDDQGQPNAATIRIRLIVI